MGRDPASGTDEDGRAPAELGLTGAFELSVSGQAVAVPHSAQRVIVFLALAGRPVSRGRLASTLWRESLEAQASRSLRTALWRLQKLGRNLVATRDNHLVLSPGVRVDIKDMTQLAHVLTRSPIPDEAFVRLPLLIERRELLPDWDEEWVVIDRERYRLLRLEALECAAAELLNWHRHADALIAATAALQSEPLRETARRLVVQVQLEQGNMAEALRCYRQYRELLLQEYQLEPSPAMTQLVEPFILRRR